MPIRTALTELLAIRHPVLLAPMAGVSGGALAAATTKAGGLGHIGGGYGERGWLERELAAAGNARFGVGFIAWALEQQPDLLDLALERAPASTFLSFGQVRRFVARIHAAGSKLIVQVQTVEQARQAAGDGADVIVAQGTEAGGHGGRRATLPLVPAVVDAVGKTPVVAAGGIADGRGLAAALMLGASGVLCGTAFFASDESLASPGAKAVAVSASGDSTLRSSVVDIARGLDWPAEWNIRTLRNSFIDRWAERTDELLAQSGTQRGLYADAAEMGDFDTAAVIVGESIDLVATQEPAARILERMVGNAENLLAASPNLLS